MLGNAAKGERTVRVVSAAAHRHSTKQLPNLPALAIRQTPVFGYWFSDSCTGRCKLRPVASTWQLKSSTDPALYLMIMPQQSLFLA